MPNLAGVVRLLKKEQDRLTKELRGIGAASSQLSATHMEGEGAPESYPSQLGRASQLPKERDGQKFERTLVLRIR
jgi:hypothetical protein